MKFGRLGCAILSLFLLPSAVGLSAATWGRGEALRDYADVLFADPNTGWLSDGSQLVATQDAGRTWRILLGPYGQGVPFTGLIGDLTFFPPATVFFRDGDKAALHGSRDSGTTWAVSSLRYWKGGLPTTLGAVQLITPSDGWALEGGRRTIWRTRSAGQSWSPLPPIPPSPHGTIQTFFFLDTSRGWLVRTVPATMATGFLVLASTTGGQSWEEVGTIQRPAEASLRRLWFVDPQTGWMLESGLGGQVHRTTDGGQTWRRHSFGVDPAVYSVAQVQFLDRLQGWAVASAIGTPGLILRTADGGQTWQPVPHPARVFNLEGLWFLTPTEGWVVGERSTILKTTDGGQTWTEIDDDLKAARRASPLRQRLDRLLGR